MTIGEQLEGNGDPIAAVLFYDGTCGFCNSIVRFVLDHERTRSLRFATLQGDAGEVLARRHPHLRNIDSVVWLEPGSDSDSDRVYVRSDAALRVARYLGGIWRLGLLGYAIPRSVRDKLYDFVARHRHRLTKGPAACRVPDDEDRHRFID